MAEVQDSDEVAGNSAKPSAREIELRSLFELLARNDCEQILEAFDRAWNPMRFTQPVEGASLADEVRVDD